MSSKLHLGVYYAFMRGVAAWGMLTFIGRYCVVCRLVIHIRAQRCTIQINVNFAFTYEILCTSLR